MKALSFFLTKAACSVESVGLQSKGNGTKVREKNIKRDSLRTERKSERKREECVNKKKERDVNFVTRTPACGIPLNKPSQIMIECRRVCGVCLRVCVGGARIDAAHGTRNVPARRIRPPSAPRRQHFLFRPTHLASVDQQK